MIIFPIIYEWMHTSTQYDFMKIDFMPCGFGITQPWKICSFLWGVFSIFFLSFSHCSTFIWTFACCVCMKNEDNFRNLFGIFKKMDAIVFTAVSFLTNWRIDVNSMSYASERVFQLFFLLISLSLILKYISSYNWN